MGVFSLLWVGGEGVGTGRSVSVPCRGRRRPGTTAPVTYEAASLHRKATTAATSSGVPKRAMGVAAASRSRRASGRASVMAVATGPGSTTLTVTLRVATSRAIERLRPTRPGLGRGVVGLPGRAGGGHDRRHVDDAAEAGLDHGPQRPAHGEERAGEVGVEGVRPVVVAELDGELVPVGAGGVDQDLDRAPRLLDRGEGGVDRLGSVTSAWTVIAVPPGRSMASTDLVGGAGGGAVADGDAVAGGGEGAGRRPSRCRPRRRSRTPPVASCGRSSLVVSACPSATAPCRR